MKKFNKSVGLIIFVFFLFGFFNVSYSEADDWTCVGYDQNNKCTIEYDKDDIQQVYGLSASNFKNFDYTLLSLSIDCDNQTYEIISKYDYDKNGNVIYNKDWSKYVSFKQILPETTIDAIYKSICNKRKYSTKIFSGKITVSTIKNFTYTIPVINYDTDKRITFKNGKAFIGEPLNSNYVYFEISKYKFADINGDGKPDAIVVFIEYVGVSGAVYFLTAIIQEGNKLVQTNTIEFEDRCQINKIEVKKIHSKPEIFLDMMVHKPTDASCCPTQRVIRCLVLKNNYLAQCE
ncbi:hypothetical protein [Desulfurella sp.]|uniref:hypothetical protein n=1 Tax=Desulfurella sp. TaxID=1962857 RepID=UPI0025C68610|nr:hypothetical protein [Desulfurella sp.]